MHRNRYYKSIDEILSAEFSDPYDPLETTDHVFKSTRLEDIIYSEMRDGDITMDAIDTKNIPKLPTFGAFSRDVFQCVYSLNVRRNDENTLSNTARHINNLLINEMMGYDQYTAIKSICEGRQFPAYDAASEFVEQISANLDSLLIAVGNDKGLLNTLDKLEQQEKELRDKVNRMLQQRESSNPPPDDAIIQAANKAASKSEQVKAVDNLIYECIAKNENTVLSIVCDAICCAQDKAEETALAMAAWGQEGAESIEQIEQNKEIIAKVRANETLLAVTKYLGRFKEMLAKARKNSYAYGRGEKYTLEHGNSLSHVLTSAFSQLATPETIPLFLRSYQSKKLLQYKRREAIFKGAGDIIMCLDESGSTREEAVWGKAVALTLLDAAMAGNRKFALIHFAEHGNVKTDIFRPGEYTAADTLASAATFLGGGTDFETPLSEALRLVEHDNFENADIVFCTDGYCKLPQDFLENFHQNQSAYRFKVTGVLMDAYSPGMEFSISSFCDTIFRTSKMDRDEIVGEIITARV